MSSKYPMRAEPTIMQKIMIWFNQKIFVRKEQFEMGLAEIFMSKCPYCGIYLLDYLRGYHEGMFCPECERGFNLVSRDLV